MLHVDDERQRRGQVVERAFLLLRQRDELVDRLHFQIGVHHQRLDDAEQVDDWLERLVRIVGEVLGQVLVIEDRIAFDDAEGVAVGLGRGAGAYRDVAGAAGPVLDDDGLTKPRAQAVGQHAGEDVAQAARARRRHDLDGAARIVLGARWLRGEHDRDEQRQAGDQALHGADSP
jgi:hypothetical protein